ncbi:MAG: NFACT family protein [Rectinemataceae bacterium]
MSLNHKEIDLILGELDLEGMKIERVLQPSYDTIVLCLYGGGRALDILVSIAHGACRIHSLSSLPAKNERPLRFMECLRSRLRGGHIDEVQQLGGERIIHFTVSVPDSENPGETQRYSLYVRLWSGAGNMILADSEGRIVDVLARRPARGEISGAPCLIEESLAPAPHAAAGDPEKPPKRFEVRDLPGEGSFDKRIEAYYSERGEGVSREKLLETAKERYERRKRSLENRIAEFESRAAEFRDAERFKQIGDILMAGYQLPEADGSRAGKTFVTVQDFYRGGDLSVRIDPSLGNVANAQEYYERYRKASSGLAEVEEELARSRQTLEAADAWIARAEAEKDPFAIAKMLSKAGTVREKAVRRYPGLSFEIDGWTILVGRSGVENDDLLRRHVRGSDMWMHARDRAGSYVFIKARKGKTIPLPVLLDAGTLALYYSKARNEGAGDLYYTFAKYLRRAKTGPKGLVIPTLEKNLFVRIDENRLKTLLSTADGKEETI